MPWRGCSRDRSRRTPLRRWARASASGRGSSGGTRTVSTRAAVTLKSELRREILARPRRSATARSCPSQLADHHAAGTGLRRLRRVCRTIPPSDDPRVDRAGDRRGRRAGRRPAVGPHHRPQPATEHRLHDPRRPGHPRQAGSTLVSPSAPGPTLRQRPRRPRGAQGLRPRPDRPACARSANATARRRSSRFEWPSCPLSCSSSSPRSRWLLSPSASGCGVVDDRMSLQHALTVLLLAPEAYLPIRRLGAMFHDTPGRC